jgi:hypothetical protein
MADLTASLTQRVGAYSRGVIEDFATATRNAEMYVPSRDEWVSAGVTASTLPVGTIGTTTLNEIGGAVTLMNGKAFFVGGSGHTGVYTSGATADACAAALRSAGARHVVVVTLARAVR